VRLLIIEDDATIREALAIALRRADFEVETAVDGPGGLAAFFARPPGLVVLDLMLPGMAGIDVCRAIRTASVVPIVILTARSDTEDVVEGLQAGADDYLVKPFDPRELIARLQAVLRRTGVAPTGDLLRAGGLEIDVDAARVTRGGEAVELTPTEYRLLLDLVRHAGMVRTRDDLLSSVWGYGWSGETRLVDVHVQRLRAKVGHAAIETARGIGYRVPRRGPGEPT
jgi:DNA-binding response OmpR family regulator